MFSRRFVSVCAVPCEEEASVPLPQGLVLVEDFVTPEEEAQLLAAVDWSSVDEDDTGSIFKLLFIFLLWSLVCHLDCINDSLMPLSSESTETQKSQALWLRVPL